MFLLTKQLVGIDGNVKILPILQLVLAAKVSLFFKKQYFFKIEYVLNTNVDKGCAAVVDALSKTKHRRSGLPDLLLWNTERRTLKLSEVCVCLKVFKKFKLLYFLFHCH